MDSQLRTHSNFTSTRQSQMQCFRPEHELDIPRLFQEHPSLLVNVRGNGLSYNDCALFNQGFSIDTSRLNHILSFDPITGIAICQAGVTFADLFSIDPEFIPAVIPGSLHATLGGGVAHDVHGKNNHQSGCLGEHIEWLELYIGPKHYHCSRKEHSELFFATLAGLGLTGVITRVAIRLRKASLYVSQQTEHFTSYASLLQYMKTMGVQYDYQVAWLDLLKPPRSILKLAHHVDGPLQPIKFKEKSIVIPPLPCRMVSKQTMKYFNQFYYQRHQHRKAVMPIWLFNNPLDRVKHWGRLYGRHGFLQFQAVFNSDHAHDLMQNIVACIQSNQATPSLAVLKYFTKAGEGYLSFAEPGFTLAIDFIHNERGIRTIQALNELIMKSSGKIYLAKDLLLEPSQFQSMYSNHEKFQRILTHYHSPMLSDIALRLNFTVPSQNRMTEAFERIHQPSSVAWKSALEKTTHLIKSLGRLPAHLLHSDVKPLLNPTTRMWVILGATSVIAKEFARLAAQSKYALLLIGRNEQHLMTIATDIRIRYGIHCEYMVVDFSKDIHLLLHRLKNQITEFDLMIAHSQCYDNHQLTSQRVHDLLTVNIINTVKVIQTYFDKKQQKHHLLFLSSIAACRGRNKNSLYAGSKAAIETYLHGLQQQAKPNQCITIARLGHIDTRLTYGKAGVFYASSPQACARACWQGLRRHKRHIYHPYFWTFIATFLRHLPWFLFRKLNY